MHRDSSITQICFVAFCFWFFGSVSGRPNTPGTTDDSIPHTQVRSYLRTMNVDTRFTRWPNKNQILFYLDSNYTVAEQYLIRLSAWKVQNDLGGCVTFVETSASDPRFKLHVTPNTPDGIQEPYCSAFPGLVTNLASGTEQRLVITRGSNGCLDSQRSVMRYWAITLGRRNEHERGDRDLYLTMNSASVTLPAAYRLYAPNEAFWGAVPPYDYCSITHNKLSEFAQPGTIAFTFKSGPQAIPTIPQLSNTDCRLIVASYGCGGSSCPNFDCDAARQAALTSQSTVGLPFTVPTTVTTPTTSTSTSTPTTSTSTTTPTTTRTTMPTTTPSTTRTTTQTSTPSTTTTRTTSTTTTPTTTAANCPMSTFCNAVPDESAYLLGPFLPPTTYMLFSGSCVMEYAVDWNAGKLTSKMQPERISTYFPAQGGPSMTGPVTLAYLNNVNSDTQYIAFFQNQAGSKTLQCVTDQGRKANVFSCPTAASSTGIIPTSTATSASSQYTFGDGHMAHYIVNAAQNEIQLVDDATFAQAPCQSSTNLLSGQSRITRITGIQILQDLDNFHNPTIAVFGAGSDGKPYVGFFILASLEGNCNVPISGTWQEQPKLLSEALTGC